MNLPKSIIALLLSSDGWLIGSALDKENPKDYDVVVPFENWHRVAPSIPSSATPNRFGGWKFKTVDDVWVDIWPDSILRILQELGHGKAEQPHKYKRLILTDTSCL